MATNTAGISSARRFEMHRLQALSDRTKDCENLLEELHRLKTLREFRPGDFTLLMDLIRCYFDLERYDDCFREAKTARDRLLQEPGPAAQDLIAEAEKRRETDNKLEPILLLWSACCVCMSDCKSVLDMEGVMECLDKIANVFWSPAFLGRRIYEEYSVPLGVVFLDEQDAANYSMGFFSVLLPVVEDIELRLRGLSSVVENSQKKALMRCLSIKASCLINLERFTEAVDLSKECIDEMVRRFSEDASKLLAFCEFLCSIGFCYLKAESYGESVTYFRKTLTAGFESRPTTDGDKARKDDIVSAAQRVLDNVEEPSSHGVMLSWFWK